MADETHKSKTSAANRTQQLGDFELKKKLGKGEMGEVFLARQISLDRLVAVKTLNKELAKRADFVARFEREAKAMTRIDHPNVVKIYAVDSFKGIHFAAIEYIDGQSAQKWLEQLGTFPVADAVTVALGCAEALKYAHEQNMVHRDIKPDNILITKKGIIKVADFGLAKVLDEEISMTQSGAGLGTPLYMPPEQARSAKHVDARCDVYALGATLYHLLTGKPPFTGTTAVEVIIAKERETYPTARSLRTEVPERLDLILDKMMSRNPDHRYGSCVELIKDLRTLGFPGNGLSFIEGSVSASPPGERAAASASPGAVQRSMQTPPMAGDIAAVGTRIWFVQFEDAKGQTVVEKHSTGRILKMLASGQLTAKGRIKASADGTYYPMAQFPEFTKAVEDSLTRKSTAIRKEDMASLYKKVDKEQKSFYLKRKFKDLFRNTFGVLQLILIVAVAGAALWYVIPLLKELPQFVADRIGLKEKPPDDVPSDQKEAPPDPGTTPLRPGFGQ